MADWQKIAEDLNSRFRARAENADRYLSELPAKTARNKSYKLLYDQTLAEFYVANHLRDSTHLASKEALVSELANMRKADGGRELAHDPEQFRAHFTRYVDNLLTELA